jgi:hypothetical protein
MALLEIKDAVKEIIITPVNVEILSTMPAVHALQTSLDIFKVTLFAAQTLECVPNGDSFDLIYTEASRVMTEKIKFFAEGATGYSFQSPSFWLAEELEEFGRVRKAVVVLLKTFGFTKLEVIWKS